MSQALVSAEPSAICSLRPGKSNGVVSIENATSISLNSVEANHSKRILELDGLRAFAILSVFVYHVWSVPLSWMGVDLFFVLSGFLITGILLGRKSRPGYFRGFYTRRARRILAPYYLLLVLSSVLFGTVWLKQWYWYAFFASNIPNALHSVPHESLDVLWSLAVEEQFYLLWPVAILFLPETALVWTAMLLIALAPVLRGIATSFVSTSAPIYHLMPFRMDLLAAGALTALLWRRSPGIIRRMPLLGPTLVACAAVVLFCLSRFEWFRTGGNIQFNNVVLFSLTLVVAVGLLLWSLQENGLFPAILRLRALRFFGANQLLDVPCPRKLYPFSAAAVFKSVGCVRYGFRSNGCIQHGLLVCLGEPPYTEENCHS
ncbi:MAG: acyltransferase family protein [Bryobacteraceae bacterium]